MENKSPGHGGGGGSICITSSTSASVSVNGLGGVGNGGSPDSTTQQNKDNTNNSNAGLDLRGGGTASPSVDHHIHHQRRNSGSNNCPPSMYSLKWNTQLLSLQRSLANLWDSGIGTDAVLLCQGTPLPVHKIVLTAASPYVASVIQTMAQAAHMMPVIVVDIPAEAGKALLSFLYCGEAHVPVTIIPHLVIGAKFLGISGFGDPGVLESLTSIVPESVMTPDKTPPPCDSPRPNESMMSSESLHIPHLQLPLVVPSVPSHLMSSSPVQNTYTSNNNISNHNSSINKKSERTEQQQLLEQQLIRQQQYLNLQQRAKSRSPFASSQYSSSASSIGEIINLSSNSNHSTSSNSNNGSKSGLKTSGGSYTTMPSSNNKTGNNNNNKSPKTNSTNLNNRIFIGTTSILDNLLKNPRTHLEAAIAAANANAEASDNNDMVQYEAEGYLENSPHNLAAQYHLQQLQQAQQQQQQHPPYYYSAGAGGIAGHPAFMSGNGGDDDNNMEMTMTEDNTPIPAQLLEPNVEYHIGNEFTDRYGALQNPLADLAKVAAASIQQGNKRKKTAANADTGANGVEVISSTGRHTAAEQSTPPVKVKAKKPPETIICEICGKKFSNAYNLRVHMEGHSGQVFVCSVCSHASRSRDALRKHFAYRHRELWISGMSAFRKNVPGRKLSISKNNNNNNTITNNNNNTVNSKIEPADTRDSAGGNTLVDANGNINIRGSDGTLTISEAFPEKSQK